MKTVERRERRAAARQAAADKVTELQAWFTARAEASNKAARKRAAELRSRPRGVDRVPDSGGPFYTTWEPHLVGKTRDGVPGFPIDSTVGTSYVGGRKVVGPYAERRARGARGHARKPRRREMPGAIERRIERNKKAVDW